MLKFNIVNKATREVRAMVTNLALRYAYCVSDAFVSYEDYCSAYLSPRLSPEQISICMEMVKFQAWCVYFEQDRDPAAKTLVHTGRDGRQFLLIEDYSLMVFLEISRLRQICILMEVKFI